MNALSAQIGCTWSGDDLVLYQNADNFSSLDLHTPICLAREDDMARRHVASDIFNARESNLRADMLISDHRSASWR